MNLRVAAVVLLGSAALLALLPALVAQDQDARIGFDFKWSEGHPQHYRVVVHRDGRAEYLSQDHGLTDPQARNVPVESNAERGEQDRDAASREDFQQDFQASDALRQKLFALAERAHYFSGELDYTKHSIAQTGTKTLSYKDATHDSSASYNYSEDQAVQQLTQLFEGISNSIEGGRKLEFDRRFDKLALDQELKNLEQMSKEGQLQEVQTIAPLLQRIASDASVLHIAQQRAQAILKRAGQPLFAASQ